MYTHLAVATDFSDISEQLVDELEAFVDLGVDRVTLVHVHEIGYPVSAAAMLDDHFKEQLQETAAGLAEIDLEVATHYAEGRPAVQIVEVADEIGADMIAIGNKGRGAVGEVLMGSVATEVLERADRPVFMFCKEAADNWDSLFGEMVLHPTDFSPTADRALEAATEIAATRGLRTVMFHVMDGGGSRKKDVREELEEKLEERRGRLEQAGVSEVTADIQKGRPRRVVVDRLQANPRGLCVIGTHGRGRIGDFFLGGVTRAIARRGTHHMLVVPGERE